MTKTALVALLICGCNAQAPSESSAIDSVPAATQCPAPTDTFTCNASTTGLTAPLLTCSASAPCGLVTKPINEPKCVPSGSKTPDEILAWTEAGSDSRYACVFTPTGAATKTPRALVVWFHGMGGSADNIYSATDLRNKAVSVDMSDGTHGSEPGFILASVQGHNLHWFGDLPDGPHWDYGYRDLGATSCNQDIKAVDDLIDTLVARGTVDRNRVYVSGWSNGAFFAQMYAIARHATATPQGNHVAAYAGYAGGNPFGNLTASQSPTCELAKYPTSSVPSYEIHRDCDTFEACDAAQLASDAAPGTDVEDWIADLSSRVHDSIVTDQIIDANANAVTSCATTCPLVQGSLNHLHWPDGIGADGDIDWEPKLLGFLQANPRS